MKKRGRAITLANENPYRCYMVVTGGRLSIPQMGDNASRTEQL